MLIHTNTESSGKFPVVFILKIYVPMFCCACSTSSWGSLILSGVFFAMKALGLPRVRCVTLQVAQVHKA